MRPLRAAGLAALKSVDPERAHRLAIRALQAGLGPRRAADANGPRLATDLAGLALPNPLGIAAGFDKNAEAVGPLHAAGFGFVEVGAATPLPQPGNPRPRLFRLPQDAAVINRFGFNNDGAEAIGARLAAARRPGQITGINLGANKDSSDRAGDFARVLEVLGAHVDFATVNVSSPNTAGLRDLQAGDALADIFARVQEVNARLPRTLPIFVKIAPDLDEAGLDAIVAAAEAGGLAGLIATNTTLRRDGLRSPHRDEAGGLSGRPLFEMSTRILAQVSARTSLPLIGVGGVGSAEDAYAKITAGASAVQLYSALALHGIDLAHDILDGLARLLARAGHATVADAVGTDRDRWLAQAARSASASSAG